MTNEKKVVANVPSAQRNVEVPVVLDGEPQICELRRPDIKLNSQPEIVIALPMGNKEVNTVFTCPEHLGGCGKTWKQDGFRHPHLSCFHWTTANMQMVPPLNVTMAYLVESGRLSAEARQIMTKKAIRMGCKYILYWDDDTIPDAMGLYTLHAWMEQNPEAGAVTGIYTTRQDPQVPLVFTQHGKGAGWDIPMGPGAPPVPVFGAGAGFLLARVEAIVAAIEKTKAENGGVEVAIWQDVVIPGAKGGYKVDAPDHDQFTTTWGHDMRFCRLLNEADWPVYAHGQVLCGHYDVETSIMYHVPKTAPGFKWNEKKQPEEEVVEVLEGESDVTEG